ncbi:MAG: F-type H+-transporting ATPase subunit a [Solirubrobacteraceae bacterium]|jgi:F-type H+-transporting ATPase subunit a|nr:F-type H+-transporting ATPase subunit a [Solirubrobacteraceae bacterium]
MSRRIKILLAGSVVVGLLLILFAAFGSAGKNDAFQPQNEFKLEPWISIKLGPLDLSINKAVLYLWLAAGLTIFTVLWIANRMTARPNRIQTALEAAFLLMRDTITRGNMEDAMARKWFPFVGTLFLFIWFSNMIGYIPLPTNTHETVDVFGFAIPTFAIYAATANISVPLVLTLIVWITYHVEGVRKKGFVGYLKSWVPAGTPRPLRPAIFVIEVISQFVRVISLSVRLFANILAGHLLILFMAGGLVVLLGLAALGALTLPVAVAFFLFEVVLISTLQAFIFATLTSIYFGGAVAEHH